MSMKTVYVIVATVSEKDAEDSGVGANRYLAKAWHRGSRPNSGRPQWTWAPSAAVLRFYSRKHAEKVMEQIAQSPQRRPVSHAGEDFVMRIDECPLDVWEAAVKLNQVADHAYDA